MTATQSVERIHHIVVGVDYSSLGDLALEKACELASAFSRTHLHLVHVESSGPDEDASDTAAAGGDLSNASTRLHERAERVIKAWCDAQASAAPFERLTTHVRAGNAAEAIAQLASDLEAELVVVGTHGRRGARRYLLGSVAEATVRLAPCAVLVVRPPDASVPAIAPPCPQCAEARRLSNGNELWCLQHREQHERRHTYHYKGGPRSRQSGFLIHTR